MTVTTVLIRDAELSLSENTNGWHAFVDGADYTDDQKQRLVDALMDAQWTAVSDLLPEGCTWQPSTSEIIGPVGTQVETASWLVSESSRVVIDNFEEIAGETLGHDLDAEETR